MWQPLAKLFGLRVGGITGLALLFNHLQVDPQTPIAVFLLLALDVLESDFHSILLFMCVDLCAMNGSFDE